jgi:hypothetical protein
MIKVFHAQAPARVAGARKASILNRVALADFQSSTKIEALREELHRMLTADPSAKALVFSQFTSMLDLIFFRLQQARFACPASLLLPPCAEGNLCRQAKISQFKVGQEMLRGFQCARQ